MHKRTLTAMDSVHQRVKKLIPTNCHSVVTVYIIIIGITVITGVVRGVSCGVLTAIDSVHKGVTTIWGGARASLH